MAVTYTFENIVINGVDTSKTYNDSTLPIGGFGVKRIICNGEDKLHKDVNTTITDVVPTLWSADWIANYKTYVLDKVTLGDGVKSIRYTHADDGTTKGFIIEFEKPATFSYNVEENDEVAGGWVAYESDTVNNVLTVKVDFIGTTGGKDAVLIVASGTGVYYDKTIEADMYDLGMADLKFEIKGRVY